MALSETLEKFCEIFPRDDFDLGSVVFDKESSDINVPEEIALSGQIIDFYTLVNFQELIISGALFLEIFSKERLPKAQIGWRWITDSGQDAIEDTEKWDKTWIVIGDRNGDAIFVKTGDLLSPVFGTIQKLKIFQLAESLEAFFNIINESLLIEKDEFNLEADAEDFEIKPEFLEKVSEVVTKFSPQNKDDFINFFFD